MTRAVPTAAAVVVALAGGAYFGLASCGGYSWHRHAFLAGLSALVGIALLVPWSRSRPWMSRVAVMIGVVAAYVLSEATAAPFYPAAPETWASFSTTFVRTLVYGPC